MAIFNSILNINLSVPKKSRKIKKENDKNVSRKCYAVVIVDNGEFKAKIKNVTTENEDVAKEFIVIPFTEKSLSLKDKIYVFNKTKDKYNKLVCIIREPVKANINYGTKKQYDVLKEGLLLSGFIIKDKGKLYFDYKNLIAFNENSPHLNEDNVDEELPLFKK